MAVYRSVLARPWEATKMLWRHRRTMAHLLRRRKLRNAANFAFVTYFVRGEDCGKGVLDSLWQRFPWLVPCAWDIEVEVTTRCYLRCVHCEHTYFPKGYLNRDLDFDTFRALVDGLPSLKWMNLTGEGSSLLNPDFLRMVREVKRRGIYVDFTHDFFRLSEAAMRALISMNVERIFLSMDAATKETYESIRVGAAFDQVVANVKRFVELKREMGSPIPELCVRMAFFRDNVHEVELLPDLVASFGEVRDLGDEPSLNIVALLEFKETQDWVVEVPPEVVERTEARAAELGQTIYWSHVSHDESTKPPMHWCTFWSEPYIMIGGHVVPCCGVLMSNRRSFLEKHSFGTIHAAPLREIWASEGYRQFRRDVVNPEAPVPVLCRGCRSFATAGRGIRSKSRGRERKMTWRERFDALFPVLEQAKPTARTRKQPSKHVTRVRPKITLPWRKR